MFDLGGGLGDLGGINFNTQPEQPQEEDKTKDPVSGISHVNKVIDQERIDNEEWQAAYQKYDAKIKMWKGMHQLNSVKVLLCTLHDVLWQGANWKRVGMHDLMEPNAVKK